MKNIFTLLFLMVMAYVLPKNANAQAFITTWKTDNAGSSSSTSITIPTLAGETYNYDVDWNNDGIFDEFGLTGDVTHDFGVAGTYTIRIQGTFPRIYFNNTGDRQKILSIDQWGNIAWTSMHSAFHGCTNLNLTAIDAPDLSNVTSLGYMFNSCTNFNANINHWDVSNITDMIAMFDSAYVFNQPLNDWNVSNVTNMAEMFYWAVSFNQPLNNWDVSNVTQMAKMFYNANKFDQSLNNWDVSSVTNMSYMFCNANKFNQPLNNWNVSNIKYMAYMFASASTFNQPLNNWDVSNVGVMEGMFYYAISFNQPLNNWDVSNVIRMNSMFSHATSFNQPLFLWNVSKVQYIDYMFYYASSFNQNLGNWNIKNTIYSTNKLKYMLSYSGLDCINYSATLIGWSNNTSTPNGLQLSAQNLQYGTNALTARNKLLAKGWTIIGDSPSGTGCSLPFITTWKTDNTGVSSSTSITIPTTGTGYYYDVDWNNDGIFDNFGVTGSITHNYGVAGSYQVAIRGDFPRIYFNNTGDKQKILSIDQWGDIQWSSMENAFYGCRNLNFSLIPAPYLGNVTSLKSMFFACFNLNANLNHWNTSTITDMSNLFNLANSFNQPLNNWNVSNVTNMSKMFASIPLFNQPLNDWDVSSVTDMSSMFNTVQAFNQPLNNWDVSNVTNMRYMFFNETSFNQPLDNWTVSSVTDMYGMFNSASSFNQSLATWSLNPIVNMSIMLNYSGLDVSNYDATLIGWEAQGISNRTLGATNLNYCNAALQRSNLITTYGWTITGDTKICGASFITTWKTDNAGSSSSTSITIPTFVGESYNYDVDWNNDGIFDDFGVTGDITHDYGVAGTYQVAIRGGFPRIYFNATGDRLKILSVDQWGDITWSSMESAFNSCSNLNITAIDAPDLSGATSLRRMFAGCSSLNANINHWNTTTITDMSYLFNGANTFNQPLNNWNVSNVTNMYAIFSGATAFNGNITSWDVSKVQLFTLAFNAATNFNQDIAAWNTVAANSFQNMFRNAINFNQNLANWTLKPTVNMLLMLDNAGLDVNNYDATLIGWEAQGITGRNLGALNLKYCAAALQRNNLITTYGWTITGDSRDCGDPFITTWKTDNTGISSSTSITIPTTGTGYYYDVDWNNDGIFDEFGITGDVTHDFGVAGTYTIRIQGAFPRIYFNNSASSDKAKLLEVNQWGDVVWTSMNGAFAGCTNLRVFATDAPDLSSVTDMTSMFARCSYMNDNINHWDVSNVTNMTYLFLFASRFNQPLNDWNVSNVNNMTGVFQYASKFNQDISDWEVDNVIRFSSMFRYAPVFNQPLNTWNVSNGIYFTNMFNGAYAFNQPLSTWNISNTTSLKEMFYYATSFNQNLSNWNIAGVTDMTNMLSYSALDVANYDVTLIGWEAQTVQNNVPLGAINLRYCAAEIQRSNLITTNTWTITGDARACGNPFVTTWKTDNAGTSSSTSITIPTTGTGYYYDVDWNNDGIFDEFGLTGDVTHNFGTAGTYQIAIRGDFPRIYFNNAGDKDKILSIDQWGDIEWTSMENAFHGCTNLISSAIDAPDLSICTILDGMFARCTNFNASINHWNVITITDMSAMFYLAYAFNQPLDNWNVSNVTDMHRMFSAAIAFNQPLNNWDVSNVIDMSYMFYNTDVFNQSLNNWNTSSVINMSYMFSYSNVFDQPLNNWNTSSVIDMSEMFHNADAFNQLLNNWNVSSVTNMSAMFFSANAFNQPLNTWNVSSVTNMSEMFIYASSFNQPLNTWNVSSVTNMSYMFNHATVFNQSLANWNITAVTDMTDMLSFSGLDVDNYDNTLIAWEAQTVQNNVPLGATYLKYCAADVQRSNLISTYGWTITGDNKICGEPFITTWKTDNAGVSSSTSITIPTTGTGYNYDVDWNNDGIFDEFNITGNVTHDFGVAGTYTIRIQGAFPRIYFHATGDKDKILSVNKWGDIQWSSMEYAFGDCSNLNVIATDAPDLSNVTSLHSMFSNCTNFDANINHWDVSNVTNMSYMFSRADAFNQPLNNWNVSSVIDLSGMFYNAIAFNQPLNNWDVSSVTDMSYIFNNATLFNQPLNNWNVSNVTNMSFMFNNASEFNQSLNTWNVSNVTEMIWMLNYSGLDILNYDATLIGWEAQTVQNNVSLGAINLRYCAADIQRNNLITTNGWIINGDGKACGEPFITTWKTDNAGSSSNTSITIPASSTGFGYDVDWNNDGVFDELGIGSSITHDFGVAGTYTIRIRGNLSMLYFNNTDDKDKILSVDQWGDIEWTSMYFAFNGCSNLNVTAIDAPDLSGVTSLRGMFYKCTSLNANINHWDVSTITDMASIFYEATAFNQPLNNWNVSNVTDMLAMFYNTSSFNQDLSSWNVSKVTSMAYMFNGASSQQLRTANNNTLQNNFSALNISSWDVSNVTNMFAMFRNATAFNGNISTWNTSSVTDMALMFENASSFNQNLGTWDISNVADMTNMLDNTALSLANYDNILIGWEAQTVQNNVSLGALNLNYCAGATARQNLIDNSSWTITGDNLMCVLPVELLSFTATENNNEVILNWETATEINNKGFEIEYSTDAINWITIGFVEGQGNASFNTSYDFTHQTPENGNNYYRLKQIDLDETFTYSDIAIVNIENNHHVEEFSIYPNPVINILNIKGKDNFNATIINEIGQIIKQFANIKQIDVSNFAKGMYIIQFDDASTIKFIKN
ncbi:MAG: BspA family leucine-rich repeat surface protein [Chitinophagales bacterium]|nr:BspA family leucine-rich repeat surface protein [Chitinophagales bacterium]